MYIISIWIENEWLSVMFPGQKFPRSREVTMEGSIGFTGQLPGPTDPLCTELTAYIKVRSSKDLHNHCVLSPVSLSLSKAFNPSAFIK